MTETSVSSIAPLPIADIATVKQNRRIDKASLKELAASIKTHGVLSPVLVRPMNGSHELVYGERRLRAAESAGLTEIPAIVREMSDVEALEARIIENLQREGVHPLEEADNYRILHDKHGYSAEDIAAKVGKSRAYVYGRMKLCSLTAPARKAFLDDQITASVAELIARIPVPKLQGEVTKEFVKGGWDGEPYSFRDAAHLIQTDYMLRLENAAFSKTDENIVPEAGSCSACSKRTGNQRELFPDVKSPDVCTDPPCFRKKSDAHWELTKTQVEDKGGRVLSNDAAKKAFRGTYLVGNSGLVDLKDECWEDPKHRTYEQLLRKVQLERVVGRDEQGNVHELADAKAVKKGLKEAGHAFTKKASSGATASAKPSAADRKRRELMELQKKAATLALPMIVEAAMSKEPDPAFWRLLIVMMEGGETYADNILLKRWGIALSGWGDKRTKALAEKVKRIDPKKARGMLVELCLHGPIDEMHGGYPEVLIQAARYFKVDLKKLEAAAAEELKPKTAPKKASKANGRRKK